MNKHDRDNLRFLLTISPQAFEQWLEQASHEDIDYALEIIKTSKAELIVELMEMEEINYMCDDDMHEANELIKRIKNGNT